MKLKLRMQKHSFGCGLACVATAANKSYATVVRDFNRMAKKRIKKKLYHSRWIIDYGTYTSDVRRLLKKYGLDSERAIKSYKGKRKLPELSMLEVFLRKEKVGLKTENCWHWVLAHRVGDRVTVFDPLHGKRSLRSVGRVYGVLKIYA